MNGSLSYCFIAAMLCMPGLGFAAAEDVTQQTDSVSDDSRQSATYIGAGLAANTLQSSLAKGYQLFVGYDIPWSGEIGSLAVELNYMNSGRLSLENCAGCNSQRYRSVSLNGLLFSEISSQLDGLGHLGLNLSANMNFIFGIGMRYRFNEVYSVRLEGIIKDRITSLQFNLGYHF